MFLSITILNEKSQFVNKKKWKLTKLSQKITCLKYHLYKPDKCLFPPLGSLHTADFVVWGHNVLHN